MGGLPVYNSSGLGPALAALSRSNINDMWVLAVSVFSKTKVLRKPSTLELLAMWDYAGKICCQGMLKDRVEQLLQAWLLSPPGKILKSITFGLCQQLLEHSLPLMVPDAIPKRDLAALNYKGLMEVKGIQRRKAALADDAGVKLSFWALPNKTPAQTKSRALLHCFAHAWRVMNLTWEANAWLVANGSHPEDVAAVHDCLRRAASSDYWDWHRGSSLFFWRFLTECDWRPDARDGVELWHLTDPPTGLH
jgi:hypothetical protein